MSRIITLIFTIFIFNFKSFAFEPYSGISCHNSNVRGKVEFFFKHDDFLGLNRFLFLMPGRAENGGYHEIPDFTIFPFERIRKLAEDLNVDSL